MKIKKNKEHQCSRVVLTQIKNVVESSITSNSRF